MEFLKQLQKYLRRLDSNMPIYIIDLRAEDHGYLARSAVSFNIAKIKDITEI